MTAEALSIFDGAPVEEPPVRARRRDPDTSKQAAGTVAQFADDHWGRITAVMKRHDSGGFGLGAEQIAAYAKLDPYAVRKRLPELEAKGSVRVVLGDDAKPKTRATASGRKERLWRLA